MMKSNVFDFFEKYVGLSHNVCYRHVFKETVKENVVLVHTQHEGT